MIVVADTSPLNYLIQLGCTGILEQIYGQVLIPRGVLVEMQHPHSPPDVRGWALAPPIWLETRQVEKVDATLPVALGIGEREAISLALEIRADVLLIDERAGRREAQMRHLEVAGTLAVLLRASLRGGLDLREKMLQLRKCGFRVSPKLEAFTLALYEKSKEVR